jgi:hypothetical protein
MRREVGPQIEALTKKLATRDLDTDFSKARRAFDELQEKLKADTRGFLRMWLTQTRKNAPKQQRWLIDHLLKGTTPAEREMPPD